MKLSAFKFSLLTQHQLIPYWFPCTTKCAPRTLPLHSATGIELEGHTCWYTVFWRVIWTRSCIFFSFVWYSFFWNPKYQVLHILGNETPRASERSHRWEMHGEGHSCTFRHQQVHHVFLSLFVPPRGFCLFVYSASARCFLKQRISADLANRALDIVMLKIPIQNCRSLGAAVCNFALENLLLFLSWFRRYEDFVTESTAGNKLPNCNSITRMSFN